MLCSVKQAEKVGSDRTSMWNLKKKINEINEQTKRKRLRQVSELKGKCGRC